jgi:hypothetical protein
MNLLDVFVRFRGSDVQLVKDAQVAGTKAGSGFSKRFGAATSAVGVRAGGLLGTVDKLGIATGGLVSPMGLAAGAVLGLAGATLHASEAAAKEDVNIAKMGAALKANVPNWNNDTAAVERTIAAREALAFSDDSLRQSLALLLPATKDVSKALELQSIAMDLSRLRGTDLADTSILLSKVYQGNLTPLKRFGISLKGVSTSEQALAAIQKLAGGQARAYADTLVGERESLGIALADLEEDFGRLTTGPLKDFVTSLRVDFIPAVRDGAGELGKLLEVLNGAPGGHGVDKGWGLETLVDDGADAIANLLNTIPRAGSEVHNFFQDWIEGTTREERAARDAGNAWGPLVGQVRDLGSEGHGGSGAAAGTAIITGAVEDLGGAAAETAGEVHDLKREADDAFNALLDLIFGARSRKGQEAGIRRQIKDTEQALRDLRKEYREGKVTTADYRLQHQELTGQLADERSSLIDVLRQQAQMGNKPASTAYKAFLEDILRRTHGVGEEAKTAWQELLKLAQMAKDAQIHRPNPNPKKPPKTAPPSDDRGKGSAVGGWVGLYGPEWRFTGEKGPEYILTAAESMAAKEAVRSAPHALVQGGAAGGDVNLTIYNPAPRAVENDVGRFMRRLGSLGLVSTRSSAPPTSQGALP